VIIGYQYAAWQSSMGSLLLRPCGRQGFFQRCVLTIDVVEEVNVAVLLNEGGLIEDQQLSETTDFFRPWRAIAVLYYSVAEKVKRFASRRGCAFKCRAEQTMQCAIRTF
jgi:hypothetical protein